MSTDLMLHCGASEATLDEVMAAEPAMQATSTYEPSTHGELVTRVFDSMDKFGLRLRSSKWGLGGTKEGSPVARLFGVLDIESKLTDDASLAIGIRNSTDKSMAAGLALGERVFVCDNLAFSSMIVLRERHTKNILSRLSKSINSALSQVPQFTEHRAKQIELLKSETVDDHIADSLILDAAHQKACKVADVFDIRSEWREPSHVDFTPRNAWSLFNAFTEVGKRDFNKGMRQASERSLRLTEMFVGAFASN